MHSYEYIYIYIFVFAVIYYAILYHDLSHCRGETSCPSDLGLVPFDALPMVPRSQGREGLKRNETFETD